MSEPRERKRHTALSPLMGSLGPLQFRADSGVAVGGGAFTRAPLEPDEDVVSVSAGSSRKGWRPLTYGFLTLTDRRLIYTPLRWPISPIERGPHIFGLAEIESVAVERHFKPDFVPPMAEALVVRAAGGRSRLFFVLNVMAWRKAIEEQKRRAGSPPA
jgi:hypothetical protein